jgi:serine/threonine protein kinase
LELQTSDCIKLEPFINKKNYQSFIYTDHDSKPLFVRVFRDIGKYQREKEIISRIENDCILKSFEIQQLEQIHLASEYQGEVTLRQLIIKQNRLPVDKVINFALQMLEFLRECHREEIIFRSISPDNILIDHFNRLRVIDFQDCFVIGEDVRCADPTAIREGIEYLSPEYLNRYQLDFRNDIYQLGLLLFELLAGQLPWQYRSIARLVQEKTQPVIHLHKIDPNIPVQISMIISKMMEPTPKMRFSNVVQIKQHLEQAITLHYGVSP